MIIHDGKKYLTAVEIRDKLEMPIPTIYSRFKFKNSYDRWGVRVLRDPADGQHKYCVSEEDVENIWVKSSKSKLSAKQREILKLQQEEK